MRSNMRVLATVITVAVLAGLVAFGWIHMANIRRARIIQNARESLERDIGTSLPIGSPESRVQEFLAARRMTHTEVRKAADYEISFYGAPALMEAVTRNIDAPLGGCSIHITFKFDGAERLIGYVDKTSCKNPW